jgi:hypothetical protein
MPKAATKPKADSPAGLSFGTLSFKHRPFTMLFAIQLADPSTKLQDMLQAFADFVNRNGLLEAEISWRDLAEQGSIGEFEAFLKDWQDLDAVGNASSASAS